MIKHIDNLKWQLKIGDDTIESEININEDCKAEDLKDIMQYISLQVVASYKKYLKQEKIKWQEEK